MKKISISVFVLFACVLFSTVAAFAQPAAKKTAPGATFKRTWIDYNVKETGKDGMRIHTAFSVSGLKNVDSYLQIRFQRSDGTFLKDNNNSFNSAQGEVAVFGSLKPGFDSTDYSDMALFMPYDEFDLPGGKYNLTMDIDVIYDDGGLVQHLTTYDFEFSQPEKTTITTPTTPTAPVTNNALSARFDRMWVDYGVTENGKLGMRIHVKMTAYGMKDVSSYLAIYFSKKDGTKLYGNNVSYRSSNGQIAVYKSIKPGYDPAEYNDLQIFMPYDEFNLPKGNYNLQMQASLIYEKGGLIKYLTSYDFDYTKN